MRAGDVHLTAKIKSRWLYLNRRFGGNEWRDGWWDKIGIVAGHDKARHVFAKGIGGRLIQNTGFAIRALAVGEIVQSQGMKHQIVMQPFVRKGLCRAWNRSRFCDH